ncbi:MAG: GNAT family N-acetyltransferase [Hyphomicrobiaceae bacterium]
MPIEIRRAAANDLCAVSALLGETWHATYDGIYGVDRVSDITARWHSAEVLVKGVGKSDEAFLVAVEGARILGTLSIGIACGGGLKLDRLYVHPQAQGRGLGRRLLDAGLGAFGPSKVTLEVEPANAQAIRFYERNGFVVTGKTSDCGCSGDGIAALVMTRDAGASAKPAAALAKSAVSSEGMASKR